MRIDSHQFGLFGEEERWQKPVFAGFCCVYWRSSSQNERDHWGNERVQQFDEGDHLLDERVYLNSERVHLNSEDVH